MKLDYDCVRDLLLTLEEELQFDDSMEHPTVTSDNINSHPFISKYTEQQLAYASLKLEEAGYIDAYFIPGDDKYNGALYSSITFEGHQYLDSIRSDNVWINVKSKIASIGGSISFTIIRSLAEKYILLQLGL